jgi:hypothetical protein
VQLSRPQWRILGVVCATLLALALRPRYGPPDFRYTGSDPDRHVWNFGWPMSTCIVDALVRPQAFFSPTAYVYAAISCAVIFVCVGCCLVMLVVWPSVPQQAQKSK